MDEQTFNLSIRQFLKMVGVNSQREIERAVDQAVSNGTIQGTEHFPATMVLQVPQLNVNMTFDGEISLQ